MSKDPNPMRNTNRVKRFDEITPEMVEAAILRGRRERARAFRAMFRAMLGALPGIRTPRQAAPAPGSSARNSALPGAPVAC